MRIPTRVILFIVGRIVVAAGAMVVFPAVELIRAERRLTPTGLALIAGGLVIAVIGLRIMAGFPDKRPEDDEPAW